MVKKAVTIRLDEEILQKIDYRGKRSDVIRTMIERALNPIPPKIEYKIKEIPVEIPVRVEIEKLVRYNSMNWSIFNKEILRDVIKDDIRKGMPKWYLDSKIKDWEREYGEKF